MKAISFSLVCLLGICFSAALAAAEPSKPPAPTNPPPKKSQFNSQIYEKDKTEASFSASVKVVREVQGETQVFFEGVNGFYSLNMSSPSAGSWQSLLVSSQSKKFHVQVTVDPESRQILSVVRGD